MTTPTQSTLSLEERYRAASPRSRALFEQAQASFPGGIAKGAYYYPPYPLVMERGESCCVFDVDGRRYVDCAGHHTAQILGHSHPAVLAAIQDQLGRGIALGAPVGVETELADEICRRVASVERVRFCNSGTEATLHAIRLARGFSGKPKIAKFEGGYHGSHDVVEVSVFPSVAAAGPAHAPTAVATTGGISPHATEEVIVLPYDDEAAVEALIAQRRDELACVIFDPKAGVLSMRDDFVRFVRDVTQKYGVLLIFDEIVSFRVATGGLQEQCGITPDLTTFGKIIGGGFSVGGFGGRADIMDLLDPTAGKGFGQSGTFSAHPVTMAAGLATLRQLTPDAIDYLNGLGQRLRDGLNDLFAQRHIAAQAVGVGSLFSIHFSAEPVTTYRRLAATDKGMARRFFLALLEEGYYLSPNLTMSALSLAMDPYHVDGLIQATSRAIDVANAG